MNQQDPTIGITEKARRIFSIQVECSKEKLIQLLKKSAKNAKFKLEMLEVVTINSTDKPNLYYVTTDLSDTRNSVTFIFMLMETLVSEELNVLDLYYWDIRQSRQDLTAAVELLKRQKELNIKVPGKVKLHIVK